MTRTIFGKVMWVGRATVFLVGLAVILALVFGAASTAMSATGGNFILGKGNRAETPTVLVSTLADALKSALVVQNKSGGAALDLRVGNATTPPNDVAPMKVNSTKKVPNLNADRLDGKDSSEFAPAYTRTVVVSPIGTDASNGTALLKALSRITDASASRPYLLYVEPGTYDLGTGSLAMKEYVDIQGAGEGKTLITSKVVGDSCISGAATVVGATNAELRFLSVQNTGTSDPQQDTDCSIGIYSESASPGLTHVTAESIGLGGSWHIGVYNYHSSSPTMTNVTATGSGGSSSIGVVVSRSSSPTMTNVTATGSGGSLNEGVSISDFSSPTIKHSTLRGSTYSLFQANGAAAKVALTQLVGPVQNHTNTALKCFNNYDENMVAKSCP